MQKNPILDFRVGIFVVVGLITLTVLILFIGDFRIFQPGYKVDLLFGFANGIKRSAPVRFQGVEVGQVEGIGILFNPQEKMTKVKVRIWIEAATKITKDVTAQINTLGILGEKYVELLPGQDYSEFLKNGDVVVGQDPISIQEITDLSKKIALKIDKSITMINDVICDDKVRSDLKNTIADLKDLAEKIQNGTGTLGKLISDQKMYDDLNEFVTDIKAHPWKLFFRGD